MKKTTLAGAAALTLLDISASAQGAPNPFSGFYAGTHSGRYSGEASFTSAAYTLDTICCGPATAPARADFFEADNIIVGVHGGFNALLGTNLMVGVESDWTNLGGNDSVSLPTTVIGTDGFSIQYRSELEFEWQSTIRGRFGFVTGNTLIFGTAGVAFLRVDWSETAIQTLPFVSTTTFNHSKSETLTGGVVGAGVEVAITSAVILGADYLYENFESFNSVPHGAETGLTGRLDDIDVQKVRVRVSFKFGGTPQ